MIQVAVGRRAGGRNRRAGGGGGILESNTRGESSYENMYFIPTGGRRPREVYHINIRISIFGCSVHQANEIAPCFSRASVT